MLKCLSLSKEAPAIPRCSSRIAAANMEKQQKLVEQEPQKQSTDPEEKEAVDNQVVPIDVDKLPSPPANDQDGVEEEVKQPEIMKQDELDEAESLESIPEPELLHKTPEKETEQIEEEKQEEQKNETTDMPDAVARVENTDTSSSMLSPRTGEDEQVVASVSSPSGKPMNHDEEEEQHEDFEPEAAEPDDKKDEPSSSSINTTKSSMLQKTPERAKVPPQKASSDKEYKSVRRARGAAMAAKENISKNIEDLSNLAKKKRRPTGDNSRFASQNVYSFLPGSLTKEKKPTAEEIRRAKEEKIREREKEKEALLKEKDEAKKREAEEKRLAREEKMRRVEENRKLQEEEAKKKAIKKQEARNIKLAGTFAGVTCYSFTEQLLNFIPIDIDKFKENQAKRLEQERKRKEAMEEEKRRRMEAARYGNDN